MPGTDPFSEKRHGEPDRMREEIALVSPLASAEAPRGRTESFDRASWTRHCGGYRVQSSKGRLEFVEEVREQHDGVTIAVCAGLRRARAIYLRSFAQLVATEPGRAADRRGPGVSS
jgi:hypothetical protein